MIIKQLQLQAFGLFHDTTITFGDKGSLTLVYGHNEAGKSTVLRAITDFFYGVPNQSPDTYQSPPNRMRITALLQDQGGEEYQLIRRKGRKNTLYTADQQYMEKNFFEKYLGSIPREQFSLMFGMDHENLRRGGESLLQGKGALGEALFEAASGIGGLREVFLQLEEEGRKLYKPSGINPPINASAREYAELQKTKNQQALIPDHWIHLEKDYQEQERRLQRIRGERRALKEEVTRLERKKNSLPLLARRRRITAEMKELGDIPLLPSTFSEERIGFLEKRETAAAAVKKAREERKELEEKIQQVALSPDLLEQADSIAALQERLDTYRSNSNDIPLLKGEIKELQEGAFSLLQQIEPSFSSLEEAHSLKRSLCQVETLKKQIHDLPLLQQRLAGAEDQLKDLEHSQKKLQERDRASGPVVDGTSLKRTIDEIRKQGPLEESLQKIGLSRRTLQEQLQDDLKTLGLWSGSLEEFRTLSLPLPETLRSFQEDFRELDRRIGQLIERIEEEEEKTAGYSQQLLAHELTGEVPTIHDLQKARNHRQWGWHLVQKAWLQRDRDLQEEKRFHPHHSLSMAYELSVTRADELADQLRLEVKRVERKMMVQGEIKRSQEKQREDRGAWEELLQKKEQLEGQWLALWEEISILPYSPPEMLAWLERGRGIQEGLRRLKEYQLEEEEMLQSLAQLRGAIDGELRKLGEVGTAAGESLAAVLHRAEERWDAIIAARADRTRIQESMKEIEDRREQALKERDDAFDCLQLFWKEWEKTLQKMHLPEDTAVEAVDVYLQKTEELFEKQREIAQKKAALQKMVQYNMDFESRLNELLEKLLPDEGDLLPEQAALKLRALAEQARQDQIIRQDLLRQREKLSNEQKNAKQLYEEANQRIQRLMEQAFCQEESQLREVEEASKRLQRLKEEEEQLKRQILSSGSGLSLQEIEEEAEGVKGDALQAQLDEVNQLLQQKEEELEVINQTFGAIGKEYREKKEGAALEALVTAEEAQGVLARLQTQTEEYLRLRLAALLLRQGIERYREKNQNPILGRAGELFASLTSGSFTTITVDFDEKDNPVLFGVRSTSEEVPVPGMSDGTLDQLYLALRLASLERYLENHEPIPFILDDLLVNFDDIRSLETLKVLGHLAQKSQILFFTHHASLVELATGTIPAEKLHLCTLS